MTNKSEISGWRFVFYLTLPFCQQIMENAEINNIIKIVGLQYKKSYDDPESLRSLRYGKIMIMTDQVTRLRGSHSAVV